MKLEVDFSDFDKQFEAEMARIKQVVKTKLQFVGEQYINTARKSGSYKDRTGNLRAANGYGIIDNGTLLTANAGRAETIQGIREAGSMADMELIMGNGMDYCSKIEGKGYDVVSTGFISAQAEANKQMK